MIVRSSIHLPSYQFEIEGIYESTCIMASASASTPDYDDEGPSTYVTEVNLLMKVQTAGKKWDKAPDELVRLHDLFRNGDFEIPWNPQKFGINLLTANKIRGIVLKRVLMKLYPFEQFWMTDTLDETLHKCLFVCQQLRIDTERNVVWGQCPMDTSYLFWIQVLKKIPRARKNKSEEECIQDAKSKVIAALIATRGTDWDKRIAKNFEDVLGKNRLAPFLLKTISSHEASHKPRAKSPFKVSNENWRSSFQTVFDPNRSDVIVNSDQPHTTSTFAASLRQESQDMIDILRNLEKHYSDDCVLQIDKAFELGDKVGKLVEDFDGYMGANNRGAFRDVEALTNHTDKVIKFLSKLTTAYLDFFMEFQKYCRNGRGDELIMSRTLMHAAELTDKTT